MPKTSSSDKAADPKPTRPFLGIHFECCGVYARIYREPDQYHYEGRCPKCLRTLTVRVDAKTGVSSRFLTAR